MLTDDELIEGLRAGLAPLQPPGDLIDRLREEAAPGPNSDRRAIGRPGRGARHRRVPAGSLAVAASGSVFVAVVLGAFVLVGHRTADPLSRTGSGHRRTGLSAPALLQQRHRLILTGAGLGGVSFGTSPARLRRLLEPVLGRPRMDYQAVSDCSVDHQLIWPFVINRATGRLSTSEDLELFFRRGRFVGYQYGGIAVIPKGSERTRLHGTTALGLTIGDRLSAGRRLYGPAFQISSAQGGTWSARTAQGTLAGYSYGHLAHGGVSAESLISSIDAGDTGCPSLSP